MADNSVRAVGVLLIVFEVWFAFMYGFIYFPTSVGGIIDIPGIYIAISIGILTLLGTQILINRFRIDDDLY